MMADNVLGLKGDRLENFERFEVDKSWLISINRFFLFGLL